MSLFPLTLVEVHFIPGVFISPPELLCIPDRVSSLLQQGECLPQPFTSHGGIIWAIGLFNENEEL